MEHSIWTYERIGDASRRRLIVFSVLSLCLHAGVVASLTINRPPAPAREPILSVTLSLYSPERQAPPEAVPARAHVASAKPKSKPITPSERAVTPERPVETPQLAHVDPTITPTEPKTARGEHGEDAARDESTQAEVRSLLLTDLQRYFEYPLIARRRGWEGQVGLHVTIQPDGALAAIRVVRSSGYEVLDRSAVDSLQRLGQLTQASQRLHGRPIELPLFVVYRLTN